MGYRLHVAKKYEVEYALGDAFNYKCEEFHNLLSACDVTYTGESWDSDFEVTVDEWNKVIDTLKRIDDLDDEAKKEQIREAINNLGSTADEIIQMLEYYLDKADTSDGYLHLSFF